MILMTDAFSRVERLIKGIDGRNKPQFANTNDVNQTFEI
jgi:hypothetical protein